MKVMSWLSFFGRVTSKLLEGHHEIKSWWIERKCHHIRQKGWWLYRCAFEKWDCDDDGWL